MEFNKKTNKSMKFKENKLNSKNNYKIQQTTTQFLNTNKKPTPNPHNSTTTMNFNKKQ